MCDLNDFEQKYLSLLPITEVQGCSQWNKDGVAALPRNLQVQAEGVQHHTVTTHEPRRDRLVQTSISALGSKRNTLGNTTTPKCNACMRGFAAACG